jgi:hypothetical protein
LPRKHRRTHFFKLMEHPFAEYYFEEEPKWARIRACNPETGHRLNGTDSVWVTLGSLDPSLRVDIGMDKEKQLRRLGQYALQLCCSQQDEPDFEVDALLVLWSQSPPPQQQDCPSSACKSLRKTPTSPDCNTPA